MVKDRNVVAVSQDDLLFIIRTLNLLTISLDRIGSCDVSPEFRKKLLSDFIQGWNVFKLVARSRKKVCSYFSDELGTDEMDFLERLLKDDPHWTFDNREPPDEWLRSLLDPPRES